MRWVFDLIPRKLLLATCFWLQPTSLGLEDWQSDLKVRKPYNPVVDHTMTDDGATATYSMKVLQYNTQQLVHFANVRKMRQIAHDLGNGEYDVVCLNEVFCESSREVLIQELRAKGIYTAAVTRAGREKWFGLGEDSGLFLCSKFPIQSAFFFAFNTQPVVADVLANKGFLIVSLVMPDKRIVGLGMTHTQAQVEGEEARLGQIQECMDLTTLASMVYRIKNDIKL